MALRQQIDSLLLYDPNLARSTTNVWVAHPTPLEEETLGKLFIVSLIDSPARMNHEIISIIQEELKTNYYQAHEFKVERAFELALQRTNQRLHQLVVEGVSQWLEHAHLLAGVISRQTLALSTAGTIHAFLLRKDKMHDILGPSESAKLNPLRIFSQLTSGRLEPNDQLLFTTPQLLDYFSLEKLRRIMFEHPPHEAVRNLENVLVGVDRKISFGALVMKLEVIEQRAPTLARQLTHVTPAPRTAPQVSMEELIARERETEQLLTPSVWPAVKDTFERISASLHNLVRTSLLRRPARRTLQSAAATRPPVGRPRVAWGPMFQARWRQLTGRLQWLTARRPSRPAAVSDPAPAVPFGQRTAAQANAVVVWLQRLPRQQKIIIGVGLVLVFALTTVLIRTGGRPLTVRGSQADSAAATAQEHISKAQAALLYGGEETARQEAAAAEARLATLPRRSKRDQDRYNALAQELAVIHQKLSRQVTIELPALVSDLSTVQATARPNQLYPVGNRLLALDAGAAQGYLVDPTGVQEETLIPTPTGISQLQTATAFSSTGLIAMTSDLKFFELNVNTKAWKPLARTLPAAVTFIQSLSFYQNRVYALAPKQNEILRLTKSPSSLGSGTSWLRQPVMLQGSRAAIVEGAIYILKDGASVERYLTGQRSTFTLSAVTPALKNATRIWTDSASKNLYLLEPDQRRILVFSKEGVFVNQYASPRWTNLSDLVINERTKTGYVLSGARLEKFPLNE